MPKGRRQVDALLPRILEDAELPLSGSFRVLLAQLKVELDQLTGRIEQMDAAIQQRAREDEDFPPADRQELYSLNRDFM